MGVTASMTELRVNGESLAALIEEIARRDAAALAELYDRTSAVVYGLALRMVREQPAAEDITHAVYIQVWQQAATFDVERGAVTNWLVSITRNLVLERLRSFGSFSNRENRGNVWDRLRTPDPERAPDRCAYQRAILIRRFLARLPLEERRVLDMALFHGLTHSQIASRTGLASSAIKMQIRRGMQRLREQTGYLDGSEQKELATPSMGA